MQKNAASQCTLAHKVYEALKTLAGELKWTCTLSYDIIKRLIRKEERDKVRRSGGYGRMKKRKDNDLGQDPVKSLVFRLAIPAMLAQFVNVLYSIVDRMYIGNIPGVGETALAGAGICGPIVTMITAFAAWIGIGGAPIMSIRLGEGNEKEAKSVLANCFVMLIGMSLILTAAGYLSKDWLLDQFGATEKIFPYADAYMSVYLAGTIFAVVSLGLNQFIICQGFAGLGMCSVMIGAVCNIVLDPVFIFAFDMGVSGAAVATVISQIASAIFTLVILFGKKVPIGITFKGYRAAICGRVLLLGMTPFIIILFDNILIILQNIVLKNYGGSQSDILLTCNTIVQSFMLMITMPLSGITGGTQSIMGYNYGAGKMDRVKKAEKQILKVAICFSAIMFFIAQFGTPLFVEIFTRDKQYVEMAVKFIKIYTLGVIPLAVQYALVDGMTGMGIAAVALPLSFFRKGVYIVLVFVLAVSFGASYIFWAEAVSDIVAPIVSAIVFALMLPRVLRQRETLLKQRETEIRKEVCYFEN